MKLTIKDFFSKYETVALVTFTEKILNGKLHFLCNEALRKDCGNEVLLYG